MTKEKIIIEKIRVKKDDLIISKRKKVYISDSDLKLLIQVLNIASSTLDDINRVLELKKRFKLELNRRSGKRDTSFEGDYINPIIVKRGR